MEYKTLGIILHDKCNASCKICSLSCTPKSNQFLDVTRLKKIINSCKGTTISLISFTGGEPFLRFDELKELIHHVTQQEIPTNVVTNAFWAKKYKKINKGSSFNFSIWYN